MRSTYLEKVSEEFDGIGLPASRVAEPEVWDYFNLAVLMNRTRVSAKLLEQLRNRKQSPATTYAAQQMKVLVDLEQPAEAKRDRCCGLAEQKLVESLREAREGDPTHSFPIIVTKDGRAAGIIKGLGESSCYALVDEPEHGLVRGTFATPSNGSSLDEFFNTSGSRQLPVEQLGAVVPVRLSMFTVPIEERVIVNANTIAQTEQYDFNVRHEALLVDHADILQQAQHLLEGAEEFATALV